VDRILLKRLVSFEQELTSLAPRIIKTVSPGAGIGLSSSKKKTRTPIPRISDSSGVTVRGSKEMVRARLDETKAVDGSNRAASEESGTPLHFFLEELDMATVSLLLLLESVLNKRSTVNGVSEGSAASIFCSSSFHVPSPILLHAIGSDQSAPTEPKRASRAIFSTSSSSKCRC
jgi:hypothetical protein